MCLLHPWVELGSLRLGEERRKTEQTCPGPGPVALPGTGLLRDTGLWDLRFMGGVTGKSPQEGVSQAGLQVRLLGTMDARPPGLGCSEERVGGRGGQGGVTPPGHTWATQRTQHMRMGLHGVGGRGCGLQRKGGVRGPGEMTGLPRGGVGGKRGPEPSWAAGGRGTYTEVIPTWPAPSPLSQPHGMVHTEKTERRK